MNELNKSYWENRYEQNETGWDIGYASPPVCSIADQITNKSIKLLIPGCGNAWEAMYFFNQGFKNIWLIDIAEQPIRQFLQRNPEFPAKQVIHGDFFELNDQFDLIIEQTFFCALDPSLRESYAVKMNDLLSKNGILSGVLFNTIFEKQGPPFGGYADEYKLFFEPFFDFLEWKEAENSIPPRAGREWFISLRKKSA